MRLLKSILWGFGVVLLSVALTLAIAVGAHYAPLLTLGVVVVVLIAFMSWMYYVTS